MSRDNATLLDLLKAARLAVAFRGSIDKAAFLTAPKTPSAVLHQLLILGEATKRLPAEFREQHQIWSCPGVCYRFLKGERPQCFSCVRSPG